MANGISRAGFRRCRRPIPSAARAPPKAQPIPLHPPPDAAATAAARLSRIEVEDGRINFKRGSRKLPLALVAVEGRFDHDAAGHWNIDVQANPMRAPASLQQAGMLRVRGAVGGVSTRLRPASLALSWQDASLADLSRLAQGRDYGVRGTFDAELTARIEDSPSPASSWGEWAVEGKLRFQGVHGWVLAGRATDPSADVTFQATWRPSEYRLLVTRCLVEAPQSRIEAAADLDWSRGFHPQAQITSSRVALADLMAWRRALRAGMADDLAIDGAIDTRATLSGWPLRIEDLSLAGDGATIRTGVLPGPIRVGPIVASWTGGTLRLRPTPVSLPAAPAGTPARGAATATAPPPASSELLVEASDRPIARHRCAAGCTLSLVCFRLSPPRAGPSRHRSRLERHGRSFLDGGRPGLASARLGGIAGFHQPPSPAAPFKRAACS